MLIKKFIEKFLILFSFTIIGDTPENQYGIDKEEQQSSGETFKEICKKVNKANYIDINEYQNLFEILNESDNNTEFPFVLFIVVNIAAYIDPDLNYGKIGERINREFSTFSSNADNKINRKVLVVVCPIDNTITASWNEYFLSNLIEVPAGFPGFALACFHKNCTICKKQGNFHLLMIYYGMFLPVAEWYKDFLYKNEVRNIQKASMPYGQNKIGVIETILNHGYSRPSDKQ